MKPIIISNPVSFLNESVIINQLFDEGLDLLHVRKPDYSEEEYRVLIEKINPEYRDKLVLNQYHSLAKEYTINRLHFSEQKRKEIADWNEWKDFTLSTSVHSIEEFNTLPECFDYAFLSPVFPSISKEGYVPVRNLLTEIKGRTNFNTQLIALGGITSENIQIIIESGFENTALLGAIWNSEHPIKIFKECQKVAHTF